MKKISLRKPVPPKAKLLNLSEDQREKLIEWLTSGLLYSEVKNRIEKEFGITFKSSRPLQHFWRKVCLPIVRQRKLGVQLPPASGAVRRGVEKMLQDSKTTVKDLKEVLTLVVRAGRIELDQEKLSYKAGKQNQLQPDAIEEENPLDDQEKLDEVRRQVFGSAPNTKKSAPPT